MKRTVKRSTACLIVRSIDYQLLAVMYEAYYVVLAWWQCFISSTYQQHHIALVVHNLRLFSA